MGLCIRDILLEPEEKEGVYSDAEWAMSDSESDEEPIALQRVDTPGFLKRTYGVLAYDSSLERKHKYAKLDEQLDDLRAVLPNATKVSKVLESLYEALCGLAAPGSSLSTPLKILLSWFHQRAYSLFENLKISVKGYCTGSETPLVSLSGHCCFCQSKERTSVVLDAYQYIATLQRQVDDLSAELLEEDVLSPAQTQDEECDQRDTVSSYSSVHVQPLVCSLALLLLLNVLFQVEIQDFQALATAVEIEYLELPCVCKRPHFEDSCGSGGSGQKRWAFGSLDSMCQSTKSSGGRHGSSRVQRTGGHACQDCLSQ